MRQYLIFMLILALSLSFTPIFGLSQAYDTAELAVNHAYIDISEMSTANLPTLRVNDIYFELEQLFNAQTALEEKTNISNYDTVFRMTKDISNIKSSAFLAHDELFVLKTVISDLDNTTMDLTDINLCQSNADQEFTDERFEQSLDLIDLCYEKISDAEATATRVQAMYKATTQNIYNYLYTYRTNIIIGIISLIIFAFLTRSKLNRLHLSRKIDNLKKERDILKNLIKRAQSEYFHKKTLTETGYTIKVSKFSEMIRDINRQIPVLMEELERY